MVGEKLEIGVRSQEGRKGDKLVDTCGVGGGGNADVLLVSLGALVTLHGYAVRRVSLKSWLNLFSLEAGVLFRMMA